MHKTAVTFTEKNSSVSHQFSIYILLIFCTPYIRCIIVNVHIINNSISINSLFVQSRLQCKCVYKITWVQFCYLVQYSTSRTRCTPQISNSHNHNTCCLIKQYTSYCLLLCYISISEYSICPMMRQHAEKHNSTNATTHNTHIKLLYKSTH